MSDGTNKVYINYLGKDWEVKMETLTQVEELASYLKGSKSKKIGGFDLKWGVTSGNLTALTDANIFAMTSMVSR